ncbi:MAG: Cys-Gln thioester bond-forming surface protein [Eubacteriaceae bacterium]|nr:Cys-Gln thioester bond-forming surface protein [Eubacteriaceae bacterium]
MRYICKKIRTLFALILCLMLLLSTWTVPVVFAEGVTDPVEAVNDLLRGIDSLQEMQDKRKDFKVSARYDAQDEATVTEHEQVQAAYASYVEEMFALRGEAQRAFNALTDAQREQVDSELLKKLTDELDTTFSEEYYSLTPSTNEYTYQIVNISPLYHLAYELSMHATQNRDMPCTLILADVSGDDETFKPNAEYSYGSGNNYELTYCCDEREPTEFGVHYKRVNLEDCTYYNSYQASKIRAIILNSYPFVSLDEMKAALKEAGVEHADDLDRGDIIAAVQFAVWFYSNRMTNAELSGDTTYGFTANAIEYTPRGYRRPLISSVHDYRNELWYWWNANDWFDWAYDADADQRVTSLFDYLIDLPGVEASGNQFVVSDIQITRTELVDEGEGTYSIGLKIILNHGAAAEDNVVMTISTDSPDSQTQTINVTGQTVYETTIRASYGETVSVTVEGTQHLEKGVYFYEPEGGYEASQALVGVSEGETRVKAEDSFVFKTDIKSGIRIYKTEEETGGPLKGIVFTVYDVTGEDISEVPSEEEISEYAVEDRKIGDMTTDSTGYAEIELQYGTYLVVEEPNENISKPVKPFYVTLPCDDGDVADLHLVNKKDEPGTVSVYLEATKEFNDWGKADSFKFLLASVTADAPMPEDATATATESEPTAVFLPITFVEPGKYEYTITEENGGVDGVSYDTTKHKVVVNVTEETVIDENSDPPGYLLSSYSLKAEVLYDGKKSLIITNTFTPAEAEIAVTKLLEGRKWLDADSFTVTLTPVTEGAPMPETEELTLTKAAQTGSFGPIQFEKAGTYEYFVKETPGTEENMKYDSAEHKVTVTVTKADGPDNALTAAVTYEKGNRVEIKNITGPPVTGDSDQLTLAFLILIGSFIALYVLLILQRYKSKSNKAA